MASFDLVSKLDMGELKNALEITKKQVLARFDFKGTQTTIELNGEESIDIVTEDDMRLKAVLDILRTNMGKRGIGVNALESGEKKPTGKQMIKQSLKLRQGIDKDKGRIINKLIKESSLKVTSQYLDDKIRITGKKIDDLQAAFAMLKNHKDVELDLNMENMKS